MTFSNTLDQMAAYGERDLRRFPHAHVLYEQAYGIGGKLHRNVEEKATKQRKPLHFLGFLPFPGIHADSSEMLAEMQAKLTEAVSLYGSVLDGQQAYAARRMQEQQQARYTQQYQPQQYPYSHYQPQQAAPYGYQVHSQAPHAHAQQPYTNGYSSSPYAYAPPQQQAAPQAAAASGLYPSMPPIGQPAAQPYGASPYAPQAQQYPAHSQSHQAYASPASTYPEQVPQQYDAYAATPQQQQQQQQQSHPGLQRASSLSYAPTPQGVYSPAQNPSAPSAPSRSLSSSYMSDTTPVASVGSAPTPIPDFGAPSAPVHATAPGSTGAMGSSPANSIHASAPPVDLASHPSLSPRSDTVALPGTGVQRSTSFSYARQQQQQQQVSPQKQAAALHQQQQYHQPSPAQVPQQQQQQQHPTQQASGPVYYETSFPPAPAAVFPDAPVEEPERDKVQHEQPKEAMLIEL